MSATKLGSNVRWSRGRALYAATRRRDRTRPTGETTGTLFSLTDPPRSRPVCPPGRWPGFSLRPLVVLAESLRRALHCGYRAAMRSLGGHRAHKPLGGRNMLLTAYVPTLARCSRERSGVRIASGPPLPTRDRCRALLTQRSTARRRSAGGILRSSQGPELEDTGRAVATRESGHASESAHQFPASPSKSAMCLQTACWLTGSSRLPPTKSVRERRPERSQPASSS
jgi:hypothetical protein